MVRTFPAFKWLKTRRGFAAVKRTLSSFRLKVKKKKTRVKAVCIRQAATRTRKMMLRLWKGIPYYGSKLKIDRTL